MQERSKASEETASAAAPVRAPLTSRTQRRASPRLRRPRRLRSPSRNSGLKLFAKLRLCSLPQRRSVAGLSVHSISALQLGALVVLAPLLIATAIAVKMDSPGDAIFRQERGGLGGKTFRIWKFRTMSVMENRGVVQAIHHDARITRLGAFLRRSSWDELPQLVNVLKGDMSIIGPRPHALEHDIYFQSVEATYP